MEKRLYLAGIVTLLAGMVFGFEYEPYWPGTEIQNDNWLYLERDTDQLPMDADRVYQPVTLPHTWNALDTLETKKYRQAASWYRKNLMITPEQLKQRLYLRFGAAGQEAKVYLNGEELGAHRGGYSAFTFELTGKLKAGENRIDVWVSNKIKNDLIPQSADYNFYGGLYRSVQLITAPEVSISRKHFGGPGYRVWSEQVGDDSADMNVTVQVDNGSSKASSVTVAARVLDLDGRPVSTGRADVQVKGGETRAVDLKMDDVKNPRLWSPEHPELYRVEIALSQNGRILDSVVVNHGFRWFKFTADQGFFLNGKSYKLHGTNRHQDYYRKGNALPLDQHLADVKLMKEAGVNWLRMAHYQQNDYFVQLCDQLGILVWEEIPYVNKGKPELIEPVMHSMMKDLIEQHFNHPAIILWGMGNETWMKDRGDGYAHNYDLIKGVRDLVHREDPVRKTVFVIGDRNYASELKVVGLMDVFGYNLYRGWYGSTGYQSLTDRLNELHAMNPDTPLILSEYGAGSDLAVHTEKPRQQDFSIEYQNDFLESHLDQIEKLDWLAGANQWAFCDFGAAHRGDSIPHVNQKGLVTFDRQKKDAFYLFKSRWSTEPVVYIESPFWTERSGKPKKTYRVFSNMDTVEFFHNGRSLGKQTEGFRWAVTLVDGENTLLAKGVSGDVQLEHGFSVRFGDKEAKYLVRASAEEAANPASHLVDGNLNTRWGAEGEQTIDLDLKKISLVNGVKIKFYKGESRTYKLEIKGSSGGKKSTVLFAGESRPDAELQTFLFDRQQELRYLQVFAKGNNENNWNSYYEIIPIVTLEKQNKNLYETIGEEFAQ
ncbi:glycoside hydrolase family 2 TIM barrel-domain containing protein [Pontiella sp. NLcol2]|uniref:Glycoside hydrolase family 2 TIM barrel-domain containing protein n=2 Tax=Pontiella agarivorans TaxID=3038953 RepID=A0ABU5N0N6_9BACT|nr:glycoside hydrolase family 2 TIM barrel-domain containing protein [Pontiella agarivorans]